MLHVTQRGSTHMYVYYITLHLPGLVPVDFQREFRVSFPIRVHVAATALVFRPTARDGACEKMKKRSTGNIDWYS